MNTPENNNQFPDPDQKLERDHEKTRVIGAIGTEIERLLDDGYDQIEFFDSTIERQKGTYIMDGVWQVLKRQRGYTTEPSDQEPAQQQLITTGYALARSSQITSAHEKTDTTIATHHLSRITIPKFEKWAAITAYTETGDKLFIMDSRGMTSLLDAMVLGERSCIAVEPETPDVPDAPAKRTSLGWLRRFLGFGEER